MTKKLLVGVLVLVAVLVGTGVAMADDDTQSPTQVLDAGLATLDSALYSLTDSADGQNRPRGADGTQSEVPRVHDPRNVEGLVGGLLNGPLE